MCEHEIARMCVGGDGSGKGNARSLSWSLEEEDRDEKLRTAVR